MRSAPIRLTKYESGFLLKFVEEQIKIKQDFIAKNEYDETFNVVAMELTNLYDLHKKLDNAFKKCEYIKAYSRKEE